MLVKFICPLEIAVNHQLLDIRIAILSEIGETLLLTIALISCPILTAVFAKCSADRS